MAAQLLPSETSSDGEDGDSGDAEGQDLQLLAVARLRAYGRSRRALLGGLAAVVAIGCCAAVLLWLGWRRPIASAASEGTLVFLFMLRDGLVHPHIWGHFFAAAPEGSYKVLAHCTERAACLQQDAMSEIGIEVVPTVPSKWCVDLVTPMYQLLRLALNGSAADATPQKFIFVSDSTLPLKPLWRMREILLARDISDICSSQEENGSDWAFAEVDGTTYRVVKHSQWVILARPDAEAFVANWQRLSYYGDYVVNGSYAIAEGDYKWSVPRMGVGGRADPSSVIPRSTFIAKHDRRCPDEEAVVAMIFGSYQASQGDFWRRVFSRTRCRTYVNFDCAEPRPEVFSRLTPAVRALAQNLSSDGMLFFRKVDHGASFDDLVPLIT